MGGLPALAAAALKETTADLDVDIVQSASDEARALLRHAKDQDAHHSPDLFHVENEINKATSLPLKRLEAKARSTLEKAREKIRNEEMRKAAYVGRTPRPRGRPPFFDKYIAAAREEVEKAEAELRNAQAFKERRAEAVAKMSSCYHPYDLETGARRGCQGARSPAASCAERALRSAVSRSRPAGS